MARTVGSVKDGWGGGIVYGRRTDPLTPEPVPVSRQYSYTARGGEMGGRGGGGHWLGPPELLTQRGGEEGVGGYMQTVYKQEAHTGPNWG